MALDADKIARRVIRKLDGIGIRSKVGGNESETAQLVRLIMVEIVSALHSEAELSARVSTRGSPNVHVGEIIKDTGKIT